MNPVVALWMEQDSVICTRRTTQGTGDAMVKAPTRDPGDLGVAYGTGPVADHFRFRAALTADALLGRASDDLLHARQIGGKLLPAGMRAPLPLLLALRRLRRLWIAAVTIPDLQRLAETAFRSTTEQDRSNASGLRCPS
jgi:hypothetical protein